MSPARTNHLSRDLMTTRPTSSRLRGGGLLRVLLLTLLWGSSFLWTKLALTDFAPAHVVIGRMVSGAAVLVGFVYAAGSRLPRDSVTWLHLAMAAVFTNVAPYLLLALALRRVDTAISGMLNATAPVWTVVIAFLAGQASRPSRTQVLGIGVGALGTLLIFEPWRLDSPMLGWETVACLAAALCYGISYVYIARFLSGTGASPLVLSAGQLVAGTALSVVVCLPFGALTMPNWHAGSLVSLLILGTLGTGVAYVLNYRIIADDGAIAAAAVIYLLPIVAILLGVLVLHERVAVSALAGALLVLAGVALARRQPPPARSGSPEPTTQRS